MHSGRQRQRQGGNGVVEGRRVVLGEYITVAEKSSWRLKNFSGVRVNSAAERLIGKRFNCFD